MRRGVMRVALASVVLLVGTALSSCSAGGKNATTPSSAGPKPGLETRTVKAANITVTITPRQFDSQQALFAVTLDTHSSELAMDLTAATLEVAGTSWPAPTWKGAGPGGHHREGELRFRSVGTPKGLAKLSLSGFSEPVDVTWKLPG